MIVIQILMALWTLGVVLGYVLSLRALWQEGEKRVTAVTLLLGLPVAFFMAAAPWMIMENEKSPIVESLRKSEWQCTAHSTITTYVMVGKVMTPMTTEVCDRYDRRGEVAK